MTTLEISVDIDEHYLHLEVDRKEFKFLIESISQRLLNASMRERKNFTISPSGYGIHWPLIDEDLSINALIKGVKNSNS